MGMDFPNLVLGPCMDTFAVPMTVAPARSMPGQPIYCSAPGRPIRGIWSSKPVVIETGTGFHSTNQPVLGVRLADFDRAGKRYPEQGDFISLDGDIKGICWEITDPKPDGQGGAELELRIVRGRLAQAASEHLRSNRHLRPAPSDPLNDDPQQSFRNAAVQDGGIVEATSGGSYTVGPDDGSIFVKITPFDVILPTPVAPVTFTRVVHIKNATNRSGVEVTGQIDGSSGRSLGPYESIDIQWSGSEWSIL